VHELLRRRPARRTQPRRPPTGQHDALHAGVSTMAFLHAGCETLNLKRPCCLPFGQRRLVADEVTPTFASASVPYPRHPYGTYPRPKAQVTVFGSTGPTTRSERRVTGEGGGGRNYAPPLY
jgi:hypothetical protein